MSELEEPVNESTELATELTELTTELEELAEVTIELTEATSASPTEETCAELEVAVLLALAALEIDSDASTEDLESAELKMEDTDELA